VCGWSGELAAAQRAQGVRAGAEVALTTSLVTLGTLAAAVVGARLVRDGALDLIWFPVGVVLAGSAFTPVVTLFNATKIWGVTSAAADRVFELLDEPAAVPDLGTALPPRWSPTCASRASASATPPTARRPWTV
jgi:ABC-type multidrug transport system fused ATPase/permease subunit